MIYHIITTPECNLCCKYCCEKAFDEPEIDLKFEQVPQKIQYSMQELNNFLSKDKEGVSIIFYGGEPLLEIDSIKQIMDSTKARNFLIQTNGILFDKLPTKYSNKFHTVLVSIDGTKETTDRNRGEGTYEKIISNLKLLKKNGFKGEIIARMCVEEPTDFYKDLMHLLKNKEFPFVSIHWQLDANMWHDYKKRNFPEWSKNYNKQITKLANFWLKELKKGKVLRLYPFMGIINSLIFGKKYYLRCGSGIGNFTILPNGKISACPIMSGMNDYYLGDIRTSNPTDLPFKLTVKEPCVSCADFGLCGGRCLYSNITKPWLERGRNELCATVKHLLREMERISPEIKKLLASGKIKKKQLEFLKYNCAEIIP
ncbi:MAG: TIGR04084 family radical SAM/SPASM domain-containing protein [Candidatus Diapherotrites archaeon]|nr:TIGR04084 family radical SAM/SPASM domain-containing protein [Candidatus Diapherotrites archaeon]